MDVVLLILIVAAIALAPLWVPLMLLGALYLCLPVFLVGGLIWCVVSAIFQSITDSLSALSASLR